MEKGLILTGFMGVGKTSVACELAKILSLEVIDLDDYIEKSQGRTIASIFDTDGEEKFRDIETEALKECLKKGSAIISTGGGVLLRDENREALEGHLVVNLDAPFIEIAQRISGTGHIRPLARGKLQTLEALFNKRKALYEGVANHVDTMGKTPAKVAALIVDKYFGEDAKELS